MLEFVWTQGRTGQARLIDNKTGEDLGAKLGGVVGLECDDKPGLLIRLKPEAEDNFLISFVKP